MRLQHLTLGLIAGLSFATATAVFAEPAVQAGETLESLSKAKVMTTVNGQPGSLQDLVSSGQVQIISASQPTMSTNQPSPSDSMAPPASPELPPQDRPAQAAPEAEMPSTNPEQLNAAPENMQAEHPDANMSE